MEKSVQRHTWIKSITRSFHYCEATGLFDSNESLCPVATASRQYDSDYARAIEARRRPEEWIGSRSRVILHRILVELNDAVRADCHVMVRRRDVNAATLNVRAISSVLGRKWAGSGKDGRKLAYIRRHGVQHDEHRGLQAGRQGRDNFYKGRDASPRRSNDHNIPPESCQASRKTFSITRHDADPPVPRSSKPTFPGCKLSFGSRILRCLPTLHHLRHVGKLRWHPSRPLGIYWGRMFAFAPRLSYIPSQ